MKIIAFTRYGSPDVLQLIDAPKPTPNDDQVLVKIIAASANPLDWHRMRADPFLVRMRGGFFRPKNSHLGADVAGVVEAVGKNVTGLRVGDEVFGGVGSGAFAEYAVGLEKRLVIKPPNISFEDAAAVPVAGLTALQAVRNNFVPQPGQHVLINGASGGIGTYAVQIAKSFGATVTGVCSTRNVDLVRSLGADHVIDYTKANFTKNGQKYDLIVDNVANHSVGSLRRVLKPEGICAVAGFSTMFRLFEVSLFGSRKGKPEVAKLMANINKDDLQFISDLMVAGKVKSVIDRCYSLDQTADAIRYLETNRARGKVIITVR